VTTSKVDARRAVLTGDFVDSEAMRAAGGPAVGELVRAAVEEAREVFPGVGLSRVDVFRGDSWQLLVEKPEKALRVALFLRAWVRARAVMRPPYGDTRIAIGLGAVRRVVAERVSESEGEAFMLSGAALDDLAAGKPFRGARFALAGEAERLGGAGPAVVALLDTLAQGWTPKQAWALCGAWRGLTQAAIGATFADAFGEAVAQPVAGNHLRAAAEEAVGVAVKWYESCFTEL
jgi:hypothetical protein